ncbi:hypothetical protein EDC94DRAFT_628547 [Helicostylum pulchrum]|nr:hypothetical protein EDC94DRAFT_628547 [Helicostylum pulchrum]
MLSVTNMLNFKQQQQQQYHHHHQQQNYKRPAVLDISNLLNTHHQQQKSPSLSPSLTSSPASISSFTSYPFPSQNESVMWEDVKNHRSHTPISMDHDDINTIQNNEVVDEDEEEDEEDEEDDDDESSAAIKAKRRRANAKQLEVLNRVFDRTFFPSTQMRAELGRQLGMSPRTVQIWFQNRRQAMRTRERQRLIRLRNDSKSSTNKSNIIE